MSYEKNKTEDKRLPLTSHHCIQTRKSLLLHTFSFSKIIMRN